MGETGSWTGSERQRGEQGVCLPPAREPVSVPRYAVPAGSECAVTRVSPLSWRRHVTRRELGFERYDSREGGYYTFREGSHLLRVHRSQVRFRDGEPRPARRGKRDANRS